MKNGNTGKGYAGSIGNEGSQLVKAPLLKPAPKGKRTVHKGKDLRTGK